MIPLVVLLLAAVQAVHAGTAPQAVVDDLGHEIHLTAPPRRIVSLAPSNTELLFALGLGERLVGVTQYCTYPPAASAIERVAGFSDLNVEKVVAVAPDLVVASRGNDPEGLQTLRQLGVQVFALANNSVAEMLASLRRLGRLTGVPQRGGVVADSLQARLEHVRKAVSGRPRPTVLWGVVGDPIYTAGSGSIIDDVIRLAGGVNLGARAGEGWPQVSLETVVSWAPEVFLTSLRLQPGMSLAEVQAAELERLRHLDGWRDLPALRDGRLVHIPSDVLTRPGPRLVEAVEALAAALHPPEERR